MTALSPVDALAGQYGEYYRRYSDPDSPRDSRTLMAKGVKDLLLSGSGETRVLDIGSGTRQIESQIIRDAKSHSNGKLLRRLAETRLISLDIAELPVRKLKLAQRVLSQPAGWHVTADSRKIPFANDTFDIGFSNLSIDMLRRDPDSYANALLEVNRVMKFGGDILLHLHPHTLFYDLSDGYEGTGDSRAEYFTGRPEDNPFYEHSDEIRQDLADAGMAVTDVGHYRDAIGDQWWAVAAIKTDYLE